MQNVRERVWPLVQATLAAILAAYIARLVYDNPGRFFAPIAALVALNGPRGERGRHALRLVAGVFLGILVAELAIWTLPVGLISLGAATFAAMLVARALSQERIVVVQAAGSAILTVAVAGGTAGLNRLLDAGIGVGVALVFSQIFFSPEPVRLLRRAESHALAELASGLGRIAAALHANDMDAGRQALFGLRDVRDRLVELARLRRASPHVARHSAIWRSQRTPVAEEGEYADELDLLAVSCIMLARFALATGTSARTRIASGVQGFAEALAWMQEDPGDRDSRQRAAAHVLATARQLGAPDVPDDPPLEGALWIARMTAHDIMLFAGASEEQITAAIAALEPASADLSIAPVPRAPRLPFRWDDSRAFRAFRRSAGKRTGPKPADADRGPKE